MRYTSGQYITLLRPNHALANEAGYVYEHRAVYFEKVQGVAQPCHWCECDLTWDTLCVDHLNEDGKDNRSENLVASCSVCNLSRGNLIQFVKKLRGKGVDHLCDLVRAEASSQ